MCSCFRNSENDITYPNIPSDRHYSCFSREEDSRREIPLLLQKSEQEQIRDLWKIDLYNHLFKSAARKRVLEGLSQLSIFRRMSPRLGLSARVSDDLPHALRNTHYHLANKAILGNLLKNCTVWSSERQRRY